MSLALESREVKLRPNCGAALNHRLCRLTRRSTLCSWRSQFCLSTSESVAFQVAELRVNVHEGGVASCESAAVDVLSLDTPNC